MPTLRERREDIPVLAQHFLEKHSRTLGRRVAAITPEAMDALTRLDFPGNVQSVSLQDDVTRFECERITLAVERCDGNRTHAARELGLTCRGLLKKMQRYGLLTTGAKRLE
jgi:DNA-binding NtrC family response regulator